jgi:hypothetical protein
MIAHIVHGFNVSDGGDGTTDKLIPYLARAGIQHREHNYRFLGLVRGTFQARVCNGAEAEIVRAWTRDGDIGIGHSNGCAILAQAAENGAPFKGLVFLNPALDESCVVNKRVDWVHVYHSSGDWAVWFSKLLRFRHPWGAMGRVGFTGSDPRYTNIDISPYGHSEIFKNLHVWGPRIVERILAVQRL